MGRRCGHLGVLVTVAAAWLLVPLQAQGTRTFKARLSTVPIEASTAAAISGIGEVTATLTGNRLVVSGTFKELRSAATVARLHVAPLGLRGPAIHDVRVTPGTAGTIAGDLTLTAIQVDHLTRSRVYLQLHSQGAPEGNLRGWLLP